MKFCVRCGKEIKDDAKFCPFCGSGQEEDVRKKRPKEQMEGEGNPRRKASESSMSQMSPQVEKLAKNSRNYFQYLNMNTLDPSLIAKGNDLNGLISFVLVSLLMALGISHKNQAILNGVQKEVSTSAFPMFFGIFFWIACGFLVQVLILFVFNNQICRKPLGFLGAFNQLFAPASVAVYISAAVFILSFLITSFSKFYLLLGMLPFALIQLAFAASLWNNSQKIKQRRFYLVFAAYVVSWIGSYLLMRIFLNLMASSLDPDGLMSGILSGFYMNSGY